MSSIASANPLWFQRMRGRIALGLAVGAMPCSALWAAPNPGAGTPPPRPPEQIYASTCQYCHAHAVAPGTLVAPILLGRKLDPEIVSHYVRNGPGSMLAFTRSEITDKELEALARWIQRSPAATRQDHS